VRNRPQPLFMNLFERSSMISLSTLSCAPKIVQIGFLGVLLAGGASANVLGPLSGGSGSTSWNASAFNVVTLGVLAGNLDGAAALAGTFTTSSDIGGGVASFGNINDSASTLTNGGVTVPYTDAFTMIDGGSAATILKGCGNIYAPAGTTASAVACNSGNNPVVTQTGNDFNFATARTSLENYSYKTLTSAANEQNFLSTTSGTINVASPSTAGAVYINLSAAALQGNGINLVYDTSKVTAIFINVAGNISASSSFMLSLNGTSLQNYSGQGGGGGNNYGGNPVLFNFYTATSVTWSGNFYGSVLAPFADVNAGGDLLGQGIFGQLDSVGETHDDFFNGTNVPSTNVSATPEPMTFALLGGGLLALGMLSRKRKK